MSRHGYGGVGVGGLISFAGGMDGWRDGGMEGRVPRPVNGVK